MPLAEGHYQCAPHDDEKRPDNHPPGDRLQFSQEKIAEDEDQDGSGPAQGHRRRYVSDHDGGPQKEGASRAEQPGGPDSDAGPVVGTRSLLHTALSIRVCKSRDERSGLVSSWNRYPLLLSDDCEDVELDSSRCLEGAYLAYSCPDLPEQALTHTGGGRF